MTARPAVHTPPRQLPAQRGVPDLVGRCWPEVLPGTSGVIRFDRAVADVPTNLVAVNLEHRLSVVYGDCRAELGSVGGAVGIPLRRLA